MNVLSVMEKLYGGSAVLAEPALCLHARSRADGCEACVRACPAEGALTPAEAGPRLDPLVCKGCGLCEPACPTGVFALKETAWLLPKLGDGPVASLTCAAARGLEETVKVPCLAGLGPETLAAVALGRTLLLILPAACEACPLGARARLEPLVAAAEAVLAAFGAGGQVSLVHGEAEAGGAAERANQLDRRAFLNFARLGFMAAATAVVRPAAEPAPLQDLPTGVPPGRRNLLTALRRRSRPATQPASAPSSGTAFATVTAGSGCNGCEACTRTCPSGALSLVRGDGADRLGFFADRCVACGLCIQACPHGLLRLMDTFSPAAVAKGEILTLAVLPVATCRRCHKNFFGEGDICAECRKIAWMTSALDVRSAAPIARNL